MQKYLIKDINRVNEGTIDTVDILIDNGRIEKIAPQITQTSGRYTEIIGSGP